MENIEVATQITSRGGCPEHLAILFPINDAAALKDLRGPELFEGLEPGINAELCYHDMLGPVLAIDAGCFRTEGGHLDMTRAQELHQIAVDAIAKTVGHGNPIISAFSDMHLMEHHFRPVGEHGNTDFATRGATVTENGVVTEATQISEVNVPVKSETTGASVR